MDLPLRGRCLCGAIHYEVNTEPMDAGYCHCSICRRSSGAPVVAWLTVPLDSIGFVLGTPEEYRSSREVTRQFCSRCGTQLTFRYLHQPTTIDVTLASLEDIELIKPQYHIWVEACVSWMKIVDELPRYPDEGPNRNR